MSSFNSLSCRETLVKGQEADIYTGCSGYVSNVKKKKKKHALAGHALRGEILDSSPQNSIKAKSIHKEWKLTKLSIDSKQAVCAKPSRNTVERLED